MVRALVTSADAAFFPGVVALLRSVRRFHPDVKRFCFVPAENFARAKTEFGELAEVLVPPRALSGVPEKSQIGVSRVFSVTVPADTVVYVDADACFCRPAPELWEVEAGKINAVADVSDAVFHNVPRDLQPRFKEQFPERYSWRGFNAGVLGLRPMDWPELPAEFERVLRSGCYEYYPAIFDQPLLNMLLLPNVRWLPYQFNAHVLFCNRIPPDVRIVHFTGSTKPWMPGFPQHEPAYYHWVHSGLMETRPEVLRHIRKRILLRTPRRVLMGKIRQIARRLRPYMEFGT